MKTKPLYVSELPMTGYLRPAQLIPAILPFSIATLWRKVREGNFPPPIKLSERITVWRAEDIRTCMKAMESQSSKRQELDNSSFE